MKWTILLLAGLLFTIAFPQPGLAQTPLNDLVILNDDVPGIDIVASSAPGTIGVIYIEVRGAGVTATDEAGAVVFEAADSRLYAVELRFSPTSRRNTVTVTRLPDFPVAYVRVRGIAEFRTFGETSLNSTGNVITLQQRLELDLTDETPGTYVSLISPSNIAAALAIRLPGEPVTAQLTDQLGVVVATLYGGIEGVNLVTLGGEYMLSIVKSTWGDLHHVSVGLSHAVDYPLTSTLSPGLTP